MVLLHYLIWSILSSRPHLSPC